jgi:hypothetical protein
MQASLPRANYNECSPTNHDSVIKKLIFYHQLPSIRQMANFTDCLSAIKEWETQRFLPSVHPAKLATVVQELINAIESDRLRIAELEAFIEDSASRVHTEHHIKRRGNRCVKLPEQRSSSDQQSITDRKNNIKDRLSDF